ncbi:MAG TPA: hypothetical protein VI298_16260 [Geobacteraceae bacterium]
MGRSIGFKCECGAWPRYENWEGKAVMNCNSCGWNSPTNEPWSEEKHGYQTKQRPISNTSPNNWTGAVAAGGVFGVILAFIWGFWGFVIGGFLGYQLGKRL